MSDTYFRLSAHRRSETAQADVIARLVEEDRILSGDVRLQHQVVPSPEGNRPHTTL